MADRVQKNFYIRIELITRSVETEDEVAMMYLIRVRYNFVKNIHTTGRW